MHEIVVAKDHSGALVPQDAQSAALIARYPVGAGFTVGIREHNNPKFHRKLMALLQHAYDIWQPREIYYQGQRVGKRFDQFRKEVTILAGYYHASPGINGALRLTAMSLNFSSMEQAEREALYSDVIDVVLKHILTNYSKQDIENVLAQTMAFAR